MRKGKISPFLTMFSVHSYLSLVYQNAVLCSNGLINCFPNNKFYSSKLKQFADDNFEFDENSKYYSKRVENSVGKGKLNSFKPISHFPLEFSKDCISCRHVKTLRACLRKG